MSEERVPTPKQAQCAELPIVPVLLVAPAGCGKTEALALRAAAVVKRGDVNEPRRILAVTFSNKAKDNLKTRMRSLLGPRHGRWVTVTNFHGLATRLIQNHGAVIGIAPDITLPDRPWRAKILKQLGVEYDPLFEETVRLAKTGDADDDLVMQRLQQAGHRQALLYEERLRAEGRIDFDDQLRHGSRILQDPAVARLYQAHFAMVMVDEVQDLTMRQLGMVKAIGGKRVTYAGDPSQGIYTFAGAQPDEVFAAIYDEVPTIVELDESYRSSPRVLDCVNSLCPLTGAAPLSCGAPDTFPDKGQVLRLERANTEVEAQALAEWLLTHDLSDISVGIVSRRWPRLNHVREAVKGRDIPHTDWASPTHLPRVVELLKRFVEGATGATDLEKVDALEVLCRQAVAPDDAETHDEIVMACDVLRDAVEAGTALGDAVASCRQAPDPELPVGPGVHLLSGHVGKGQEFEWVVVLGLEDGHVPDFRNTEGPKLSEELRVLHVMLSRARYGLVLATAGATMTRFGWRSAESSRWYGMLAATATGDL